MINSCVRCKNNEVFRYIARAGLCEDCYVLWENGRLTYGDLVDLKENMNNK